MKSQKFLEDASVEPQGSGRTFDVCDSPRKLSAVVFDPIDESTWLPTLTADQIAAIWQRPVGGIKKACQQGRFIPAPFQVQPYRWRKADVVRHLRVDRTVGRKAS